MNIRPDIAAMSGYTPGEQPDPTATIIKLNTNENPYPPSPKVNAVLADLELDVLRKYPAPFSTGVRESLAKELGVNTNNVIIGNGSDDILTIITRVAVATGQAMAAMTPTYSLYITLAQIQGAEFKAFDFAEGYGLSDDFVNSNAALKCLPNPNAPTGSVINKEDIRRLCRESQGIVLVDEAYVDFADDGTSSVDLINEFDNLLVTRTLSKSYSLAGLRVGFGIANEALIAEMDKVRDSYNVDALSQALATAAIDDSDYMRANAERIRQTRNDLTQSLSELGFDVLPSQTNFVLAKPPASLPADSLYNTLKAQNILVRYFSDPQVSDYVRITIGTDDECQALVNQLRNTLGVAQ